MTAQLAAQVQSVLDDVAATVAMADTSAMEPVGEHRLFNIEIGADRAQRGIHPVESLRAATTLFGVMLPVLTRELAPLDGAATMRISRVLHEAIMARVALASLSYVAFLMETLQASRQEERSRIVRELHDRVLHGMGLALQHLDLHRYYTRQDPAPARARLDCAVESLQDAVRTVQQLSAELRRSVGKDGLERALRSYLEANVPPAVGVTISTAGDAKTLPTDVTEELYLILREAIRNALRHAEASHLQLQLDVDERRVLAAVVDDGCGFDTSDPSLAGGGLLSMRERALLLRGRLNLFSSPGAGTRVEVRVRLSENGL
nr:histidine kinase [Micromonospora sp. DSM 115978]